MKAVIAIDSLKGSLSSIEAGNAVAEGIRRADSRNLTVVRPLADGGEGTVDALVYAMNGEMQDITVTGPLGTPVHCTYGIIRDTGTAVLEMSGAAGITLIPDEKKNPLHTTTYGVGEVIKDAISKGCRRFIIGIGGSATNDGGAGMLQALGFEFSDSEGRPIAFGAKGLEQLASISGKYALPQLEECEFHVACDVENVLCGPNGCSAVFGPQKGADEEMVRQMDQWMNRYAGLAVEKFPTANPLFPGAGAAGGLGFAFLTFLHASLESGIEIILRETGLEEKIRKADIVITGEGRLDRQSMMGKAPVGVARLAKKYGKPVLAFAGSIGKDARACNENGIDAYFSILPRVITLEEAMDTRNAGKNMTDTVEQAFRLLSVFS